MSGVRFLRRLRADQDGEAAAFAGASGRGGTAFFCFTGRGGADSRGCVARGASSLGGAAGFLSRFSPFVPPARKTVLPP